MVNQPNSKSNATNLHRNFSAPRPIGKPSNDLQYTNKSIGGYTQNNMLYSQGLYKEKNICQNNNLTVKIMKQNPYKETETITLTKHKTIYILYKLS